MSMLSPPDFRLPLKEASQEGSSNHRHTPSARSSSFTDSSRRVSTRNPEAPIFGTLWERHTERLSPEIHILSRLDKVSAGCPSVSSRGLPTFASVNSSSSQQSVAPDGVLRIHICTLEEPANHFAVEYFSKPFRRTPA